MLRTITQLSRLASSHLRHVLPRSQRSCFSSQACWIVDRADLRLQKPSKHSKATQAFELAVILEALPH